MTMLLQQICRYIHTYIRGTKISIPTKFHLFYLYSSHRSNFSYISDPSGTPGPQMTQRNNNKYYTQSGESFTTSKNGEDNVPPPKIAPPVFLSVPPPPPVAPQNGPPVPPSRTRPPPGYMTGGPPRRNAPVRSHSMSIADVNRYVCNRIALQKCFSRENNCIL